MYRIIFTRTAKKDMLDIGDYIAYTLSSPDTAYSFITHLRESIDTLQHLPKRYPLVDDIVLSNQGVYCMPYKNYYVFYQIKEPAKIVIILRVGYNRRNWKEILRK